MTLKEERTNKFLMFTAFFVTQFQLGSFLSAHTVLKQISAFR